MGKEHLCDIYPKGEKLQAVIHEVRYQILMRLFHHLIEIIILEPSFYLFYEAS